MLANNDHVESEQVKSEQVKSDHKESEHVKTEGLCLTDEYKIVCRKV